VICPKCSSELTRKWQPQNVSNVPVVQRSHWHCGICGGSFTLAEMKAHPAPERSKVHVRTRRGAASPLWIDIRCDFVAKSYRDVLPTATYGCLRRHYVLLFLSPAAPGSVSAQFPEVILAIVKFSLEGADHTTWNGDASVRTPTPLGGFTNVQSTSIGAYEETALRLIASHRILASCLCASHQAEPWWSSRSQSEAEEADAH